MATKEITQVIGIDDTPHTRGQMDAVRLVGTVFSGRRLEGVLTGSLTPDGDDAAAAIVGMIADSKFAPNLHLVLLQGITFGGFNVVDLQAVGNALNCRVMVVARREPDMPGIKHALMNRVPGGEAKWRLIEQAGPMELIAGVRVQRQGLSAEQAETVIKHLAIHGQIPEPLRMAHLIAGALVDGQSRGRT